MNDYPRRRRLEPEPPKRGGLPIVPLVVLVILGGLLLGGLLTKLFGGSAAGTHEPVSAPSFTPLPEASATAAVPVPSPSPRPHHTPHPSPSPRRTPSPHPSASATPTVKPSATPSPTPAPTIKPTARPTLRPTPAHRFSPHPHAVPTVIFITPPPRGPRTPEPTYEPPATPEPTRAPSVTPTPVLITGAATAGHAGAIVRSYIAALARGDSATAAGYLAGGLPSESFINPNVSVSVSQLQTVRNGDGSFTVTAQIATSKGNYLETFTLRPGSYGMQITDHNATRM